MPTIKDYVESLKLDRKTLVQNLNAQGVKASEEETFTELAPKVLNIISGGEKDVNFYDYDGKLLYAYTTEEFLTLTEMPDNPDHTDEGLIAEGWNWSLEKAQEFVSDYDLLDIGQLYKTDDNSLRYHVELGLQQLDVWLKINFIPLPNQSVTSNDKIFVDWGDGNVDEDIYSSYATDNNNKTFGVHHYAEPGNYIIKVYSDNKNGYSINIIGTKGSSGFDTPSLFGHPNITSNAKGRTYMKTIKGINTSEYTMILDGSLTTSGIRFITMSRNTGCFPSNSYGANDYYKGIVDPFSRDATDAELKAFIIPPGYNRNMSSSTYMYLSCIYPNTRSLERVIIPEDFVLNVNTSSTSLGSYTEYSAPVRSTYKRIIIPKCDRTLTSISTDSAQLCYGVSDIVIANDITFNVSSSSRTNYYLFRNLINLKRVKGLSKHITNNFNIWYMFYNCAKLEEIDMSHNNNLTSVPAYFCSGCLSLKKVKLPETITSIASNSFEYCVSLNDINLPDGITSIEYNAFNYCSGLSYLLMPASLSSIGNNVFTNASITLDFRKLDHIPTITTSSLPYYDNPYKYIVPTTGCKILVPEALYADWIIATNWSNYANYIYPVDSEGNILPKP